MSVEWMAEANRRDREAARVAWEAANPNEPFADPWEMRLHALLDAGGSTLAGGPLIDDIRAEAERIKADPVRMAELSARFKRTSSGDRRRVLREYVVEEEIDEEFTGAAARGGVQRGSGEGNPRLF